MLLELNNNIATIKDTTLEELKQFMVMANVTTIDSVVINMAKEEVKETPQSIEVDEEPEVDENLLDEILSNLARTSRTSIAERLCQQ